MATTKKSRSGPTIPESQRHTVQVKLRLPQKVADKLRAEAGRADMDVSAFVAAWIERL